MRFLIALGWTVVVAGGFITYCALWSNGTLDWFDPFDCWWPFFLVLFVVPVLIARREGLEAQAAKQQPGYPSTPFWTWIFVIASLSPLLVGLGILVTAAVQRDEIDRPLGILLSVVAGPLTAWGCWKMGRTSWHLAARWGVCMFLTCASWLALAASATWMRS